MKLVCDDLSLYNLEELDETRRAVKKLIDVDFDVDILSGDLSARLTRLLRMLNEEILKRKEAANA